MVARIGDRVGIEVCVLTAGGGASRVGNAKNGGEGGMRRMARAAIAGAALIAALGYTGALAPAGGLGPGAALAQEATARGKFRIGFQYYNRGLHVAAAKMLSEGLELDSENPEATSTSPNRSANWASSPRRWRIIAARSSSTPTAPRPRRRA